MINIKELLFLIGLPLFILFVNIRFFTQMAVENLLESSLLLITYYLGYFTITLVTRKTIFGEFVRKHITNISLNLLVFGLVAILVLSNLYLSKIYTIFLIGMGGSIIIIYNSIKDEKWEKNSV